MPAETGNARRRLVIPANHKALKNPKKRAALMEQAAQQGFDTIIFPFGIGITDEIIKEAASNNLTPETGGWSLSQLLPRKYFFLHGDYFRMESGKRKRKIHFCTTNPKTIAIIRTESEKIFASAGKIQTFHLWPDRGQEKNWCSCPACRAFSATDQYRMAVNAAADVLAEINPDAKLSYSENGFETGEGSEIQLRLNVFKIDPSEITLLKD